MHFAKLLLGWAISLPALVATFHIWNGLRRQANGGFLEALLGLGVLLLVPSFLFTLIIAWPTTALLTTLPVAWFVPPLNAALLAMLMWALTRLFLRNGWAGVEYTLIAYAGVLGLVLGGLNFVSV